jgi:hypothetical protein
VIKRSYLLISAVLLCALAALAQDPVPSKAGASVVRFSLEWKIQNPPHYLIRIDSNGPATYDSQPTADADGASAPDPYHAEWTASEVTRSKVFDDLQKLNYLQGHYESKAKVAQTGTKTLSYKDASHDTSATYNYSENPLIRDLTQMFQSIATTAEMGRKLEHDARFNKLGIDADLKSLQDEQRDGNAIELAAVQEILQKIADDPNMMRMSQQRAKAILRAAGLSPTPAATSAEK